MRIALCLSFLYSSLALSPTMSQAQPALRHVDQASRGPVSPELYFVVVGSQDYMSSAPIGNPAITDLPSTAAPRNSAAKVADALMRNGARYGVLLTSDETHFIDKEDIRRAIIDLKTKMRKDMARNPIFLFYYMGHGLGDQSNRFLYLIPGNMVFDSRHDANQTDSIMLLKRSVWSYDVITSFFMMDRSQSMAFLDHFFPTDAMPDMSMHGSPVAPRNPMFLIMQIGAQILSEVSRISLLEKQLEAAESAGSHENITHKPELVPYVILFDDCYGDVTQDLWESRLLTGTNMIARIFRLVSAAFSQYLNVNLPEIETNGLVLYATSPGTNVWDFPDPEPTKEQLNEDPPRVGPLARRLLLLLDDRNRGPLSFGTFRERILDDGLGRLQSGQQTPVPYSISNPSAEVRREVLFVDPTHQSFHGKLDVRRGSASRMIICCGLQN